MITGLVPILLIVIGLTFIAFHNSSKCKGQMLVADSKYNLATRLLRTSQEPSESAIASRGSTIPSVIHFVYGLWDDSDAPLPEMYQRNLDRWSAVSGMTVNMWNRAMIEEHILDDEWRPLYNALPRNIQRADLVRPLIMRKYGGVYLDLDIRPTDISIAALLRSAASHETGVKRCILFGEADTSRARAASAAMHSIRHGVPEAFGMRYSNYAMASAPNHPFWDYFLSILRIRLDYVSRAHGTGITDYDVLFTTGPDAITHALNSIMLPDNSPTPVPEERDMPRISQAQMADAWLLTRAETDCILYHECSGLWRDSKDA
jgi:mannosyltransferase OCH1-like enzyme